MSGDCCVSVSEGKERDLGITDSKPKSVFGSFKGEFYVEFIEERVKRLWSA